MNDYGSQFADRQESIIAWRLKKVYAEAQKDIAKKMSAYAKRFAAKEAEMRKLLEAGKITEQEFRNWRMMKEFAGDQWKEKSSQAAQILLDANKTATDIIRDGQFSVFSENANFQAYNFEKDMRGGISFDIYDTTTVAKLLREKPELLPRKVVNGRKDKAWNQGIISNCVAQAIIQGESIPDLAKRIARDTASRNSKAMLSYARTAMTAAQNSGRLETMRRSRRMGIKVRKSWMATLDDRTRDAHAELDGVTVDIDEPFVNELGEIDYPGDPGASPDNTWGCRCTLGYEYPEYASMEEQRDNLRYDQESGELIENMSYKDWKKWKTGKLAYVASGKDGKVDTDIRGAESSGGNWEKLAERIEYGELFDEAAVRVTEQTLDYLYDEYPLSERMGVVGDIRVIRNLDRTADGLDLVNEYGFGAHYLNRHNSIIEGGKAGIEILSENYSTTSLQNEFKERNELRQRYGYQNKSTAFFTSSDTLEGTIIHEYAHAIQEEFGLYGGSRTKEAAQFSEWLYDYWGKNKEDARQISNYAADHPYEMMAEAFVQLHDKEHKDTVAYRVASDIWKEFEDYRNGRGRYAR